MEIKTKFNRGDKVFFATIDNRTSGIRIYDGTIKVIEVKSNGSCPLKILYTIRTNNAKTYIEREDMVFVDRNSAEEYRQKWYKI